MCLRTRAFVATFVIPASIHSHDLTGWESRRTETHFEQDLLSCMKTGNVRVADKVVARASVTQMDRQMKSG